MSEYTKNKFHPFEDTDGNGVIIVTAFEWIPNDPNEMIFVNISKQFTPEGLPTADEPEKSLTFDFQNLSSKPLQPQDMEFIITQIDKLYTNELNSLCLRNVPQMNYEVMAGIPIPREGAVQWERADFQRLAMHLRMLYDNTLTKQ